MFNKQHDQNGDNDNRLNNENDSKPVKSESDKSRENDEFGANQHQSRTKSSEALNGLQNIMVPYSDDVGTDSIPVKQASVDATRPLTQREQIELDIGPKYRYIHDIGAGAFGKVIKVERIRTEQERKGNAAKNGDAIKGQEKQREFYAVKIVDKIFSSKAKAKRFLREIRILRLLSSHEAIVNLVDIVTPTKPKTFTQLSVVLEAMPTDLKQIFRSKQYFSSLHIEYILYQILLGLQYVHSAGIVHRDLKPGNIIIDEDCTIKIIDFGLARGFNENFYYKEQEVNADAVNEDPVEDQKEAEKKEQKMKQQNKLTKHVVTRWYRAPEVILLSQEREFVYGVDMWSIGCIFGELLQMHQKNCGNFRDRRVLFPGRSCFPYSTKDPHDYQNRTGQLRVVFNVIGTPTKQEIARFHDKNVQVFLQNMTPTEPSDLSQRFPGTNDHGIKLLMDMLRFDMTKRITVEEALKSPYFDNVRDEAAEMRHNKVHSFEFEDIDVEVEKLRGLILEEILYFNPQWKKELKQQLRKKQEHLKELQRKKREKKMREQQVMEEHEHVIYRRPKDDNESQVQDPKATNEEDDQGTSSVDVQSEKVVASEIPSIPDQKEEVKETEPDWSNKMNRYKKIEDIHVGKFGAVYKVEDQKTKKVVAVKMLKLNKFKHLGMDKRELLKRIKTGIRVLKSCDHQNIIKHLDDYQNKAKEIYIVTEFCAGGNLRKYMTDNGPLNEEITRSFASQLKDALLYMRKIKVTHRNLNPEHILLSEASKAAVLKITGFGESQFKTFDGFGVTACKTAVHHIDDSDEEQDSDTLSAAISNVLTPDRYVAPELAAKGGVSTEDTYRSNVDLWSFGMILYEMMTNKLPYDAVAWEMKGPYATLDELLPEIQGNIKEIKVHDDAKALMSGLLQPHSKDRKWDILESNKWLM